MNLHSSRQELAVQIDFIFMKNGIIRRSEVSEGQRGAGQTQKESDLMTLGTKGRKGTKKKYKLNTRVQFQSALYLIKRERKHRDILKISSKQRRRPLSYPRSHRFLKDLRGALRCSMERKLMRPARRINLRARLLFLSFSFVFISHFASDLNKALSETDAHTECRMSGNFLAISLIFLSAFGR
jgi:hypothetical protein